MTSAEPRSPPTAPPPTSTPPRHEARGLQPILGVLVLIVVMVVAGAGTFFLLPSTPSSGPVETHPCPIIDTGTSCRCTTPDCGVGPIPFHEVRVQSPFGTAQAGAAVAFTATLPGSLVATSFSFNFGDGSPALTSPASTVDHTYAAAGNYYVFVQATDTAGNTLDNLNDLLPFTVSNSFAGDTLGNYVQTAGAITANNSGGSSPTSFLKDGGSLSVSAWISSNVTNPTTAVAPSTNAAHFSILPASASSDFTISTNGATGWTPSTPATSQLTVASSAPTGEYALVYTVPTLLTSSSGTITAYSNYTFSLYVGGGQAPTTSYPVSPHPGVIDNYEEIPGGAASEDPSIDYESAGGEVIGYVYQTFVAYNGTQAGPNYGSYVPDLATCVPGSPECNNLYKGDTEASPYLTDGENYTFVLNPNARFYDPYASGGPVMYQVHPYDVVYSIVRTCLFAGTYSEYGGAPGYQSNPGWILCQSLLPNAFLSAWQDTSSPLAPNPTWDNGLHFPLNNTPANLLSSMTINDTKDCPQTSPGVFVGAGCVTFHTGTLTGSVWPEFLEFLADPAGAAIQSCAWGVGSGGVALQGWLVGGQPQTCRNVPANASASGGTNNAPGQFPSDTAWDSYIPFGTNGNYNTYLRYHMVGSGPYYLQSYVVGQQFGLALNPGWGDLQDSAGDGWSGGCQGGVALGCMPSASQIVIKQVSTVWETTQGPGEAAYQAGTADFATIPSTDTSLLLQLESEGKVGAVTSPTLDVFFTNYNLAYAQGIAQTYTSTNLTAPSWIMQDYNLRHFLSAAYPYGEVEQSVNTVDGIQYAVNYGGAIPIDMGTFYPTNISWPSGNPDSNPSDVGGAAWWWAQTAGDNAAGKVCTSGTPCTIPFFSYAGDPTDDEINTLWVASIEKISGGAIVPVPIDVPFITLVLSSFANSGSNQMAMYVLGWAPDYPDPTDYIAPMYSPAGTYTIGSAIESGYLGSLAHVAWGASASGEGYNAQCSGGEFTPVVTQTCQGSAYGNMTTLFNEANSCAPPTCSNAQRALLYNMGESIANNLAFMQYRFQEVGVGSYASWISLSSFTPNPMTAGFLYYNIQYASS